MIFRKVILKNSTEVEIFWPNFADIKKYSTARGRRRVLTRMLGKGIIIEKYDIFSNSNTVKFNNKTDTAVAMLTLETNNV